MKKYFLFLVLIIYTIIISGCNKTLQTHNEIVDTKKKLDERTQQNQDIFRDNEKLKERIERVKELNNIGKNLLIEDWPVYKNEGLNFSTKYPKNWYFRRDIVEEKKIGGLLVVGFASNDDILNGPRPYPIELIIMPRGEKYSVEKDFISRSVTSSVFTSYNIGVVSIIGYDDEENISLVRAMGKSLDGQE